MRKAILSLVLVLGLLGVFLASPRQAEAFSFPTLPPFPSCPPGTIGFPPICIPVGTPPASPTPTPTVTPTPVVTPTPTASASATPTVEPTVKPSVAPDPGGAPSCDTGGSIPAPVTHAVSTRLGASNAVIAYWPTVLGGQVNIRYREVGSTEWHHALRDYPNLGVAPLGFLTDGVQYEYQIANGHGCNQSAWGPVFGPF